MKKAAMEKPVQNAKDQVLYRDCLQLILPIGAKWNGELDDEDIDWDSEDNED